MYATVRPVPRPTRQRYRCGVATRANSVDHRLGTFRGAQRDSLDEIRSVLHQLVPGAEEAIAYGMPTLRVRGKNIVHFDGFARHNAVFPSSGSVVARIGPVPEWCRASKSGLAFPVDRVPPRALLRKLIAARQSELGTVEQGLRLDFFRNGRLRAEGPVKAGELHGTWRWYRQDGSLLRTGRFARGQRVGAWATHDRSGRVVRTRTMG